MMNKDKKLYASKKEVEELQKIELQKEGILDLMAKLKEKEAKIWQKITKRLGLDPSEQYNLDTKTREITKL